MLLSLLQKGTKTVMHFLWITVECSANFFWTLFSEWRWTSHSLCSMSSSIRWSKRYRWNLCRHCKLKLWCLKPKHWIERQLESWRSWCFWFYLCHLDTKKLNCHMLILNDQWCDNQVGTIMCISILVLTTYQVPQFLLNSDPKIVFI